MNKIKLLSITSICLLILNVTLLGVVLSQKPKHHREDEPKKIIIEKLNFDNQQIIEYQKLIDAHRKKNKNPRQRILNLKNELYATLKNTTQANPDSLITKIINEEKNIEQNNFNHFQDIKKICKATQLDSYNELVVELAAIFTPKPMR